MQAYGHSAMRTCQAASAIRVITAITQIDETYASFLQEQSENGTVSCLVTCWKDCLHEGLQRDVSSKITCVPSTKTAELGKVHGGVAFVNHAVGMVEESEVSPSECAFVPVHNGVLKGEWATASVQRASGREL